jgi:hypothetical protein
LPPGPPAGAASVPVRGPRAGPGRPSRRAERGLVTRWAAAAVRRRAWHWQAVVAPAASAPVVPGLMIQQMTARPAARGDGGPGPPGPGLPVTQSSEHIFSNKFFGKFPYRVYYLDH